MLRGILVLALLLTGLAYWDRTLSSHEIAEREESGRLRKLIDEETQANLTVAGLRIQTAAGEDFLYARARGVWRLVEPPVGTYASAQGLLAIVQSLVDAEGVVLTDEKRRAKSYGFGSDVAVRITLHGTQLQKAEDGDVLYCIDLGYPIPGTQGAYVRPLGTHEVWAIDQNPRANLARPPGSSFPPLLDPFVIPSAIGHVYQGFEQIAVVREKGESYALERVERTVETEGELDHEWILVRADGSRETCDPVPVTGYSLFLQRVPYDRIVGPADLDPSVGESPAVRLVLTPLFGDPFELLIGDPSRSGSRTLVNTGTQTAFGIAQETFELLVPSAAQASDEEQGNPWHEFIQVNPLAGVNPLLNPVQTR